MGFFSRNKASEPAKVVRPIVVQPSDLPEFSVRLEAVERSFGTTDAAIRASILALTESIGALDAMDMLRRGLDPQEETKRPWRWFAKACGLANECGDYNIAPRVFLFTGWWKGTQPHMTLADYLDMRLDPVPSDAEQTIAVATSAAISQLDDDHVIAEISDHVYTVGQIRERVQDEATP
jgi:hypothetical protein